MAIEMFLFSLTTLLYISPAMANPECSHNLYNVDGATYVFLDGGKIIHDVNIGTIEYGLSETKVLRFIPSNFSVNEINKIKRLGCSMCSNTKFICPSPASSKEGFYQCEFVFNQQPGVVQELGEYEDLFAILSKDNIVLGQIKIKHSTVLSKQICPNQIIIDEVIPEKTYRKTFHKTTSFTIKSVRVDHPKIYLKNWHNDKDSLEIELAVKHTYKNEKLHANLVISQQKENDIAIPMTLGIKEFIEVNPATIFLGVLEPGQEAKQYITIRSSKKFVVLKCDSNFKNFNKKLNRQSDFQTNLSFSFTIDETINKGAFKKNINIWTQLSKEPINIIVYGIIVSKRNEK